MKKIESKGFVNMLIDIDCFLAFCWDWCVGEVWLKASHNRFRQEYGFEREIKLRITSEALSSLDFATESYSK